MKKVLIVSTFILSLFMYIGTAFANDDVSYIVRLKKSVDPKNVLTSRSLGAATFEVLVPELNLVKVTIKKQRGVNALNLLKANDAVKYAQEDHPVKMREVSPNDPEFARQWNLKSLTGKGDIKATEAWALGTKGTNNDGQDVVVAVVDGGIELTHADLKENIWVNKNEIPANGIDDDGNGYVDDINGWNAQNNSGTIGSHYHATHVAGIVSAKSDNANQVAGVNWNVKMMSINGSSGTTSVVARAYGYVLKQKKLFIETNGQKGANVVATNSSFGVDRANCANGDFPVWNDLYEEMGKAGIISAAATANAAWDIDVIGDVPTGCTSDYMFSVTNTTKEDKINTGAGWGTKTIDIGAPGTSILSTYSNNTIKELTGTSMATPHVAGAIAYLHTVASPQLLEIIRNNPAEGGLILKKILMDTADPISDLQGKTVSGGRLNLSAAAQKAFNFVKK